MVCGGLSCECQWVNGCSWFSFWAGKIEKPNIDKGGRWYCVISGQWSFPCWTEQGSPLKAMGARRWFGFTLAKKYFFFFFWVLWGLAFIQVYIYLAGWLAGWRVCREGSQVTCFGRPEQARTLRNSWPGPPLSIALNSVMKGKEKTAVEP